MINRKCRGQFNWEHRRRKGMRTWKSTVFTEKSIFSSARAWGIPSPKHAICLMWLNVEASLMFLPLQFRYKKIKAESFLSINVFVWNYHLHYQSELHSIAFTGVWKKKNCLKERNSLLLSCNKESLCWSSDLGHVVKQPYS